MRDICAHCMRWIHQDDDQTWRHDSHDRTEWCADGRPATPLEEQRA